MRTRSGSGLRGASARRGRCGLSLVELLTAVAVLGIGILGLAAGSGWMVRTGASVEYEEDRATALQAVVEAVRAVPFEALAEGKTRHGDYEVKWTIVEEMHEAVLIRFTVEGPTVRSERSRREIFATGRSADTLDYVRTRP